MAQNISFVGLSVLLLVMNQVQAEARSLARGTSTVSTFRHSGSAQHRPYARRNKSRLPLYGGALYYGLPSDDQIYYDAPSDDQTYSASAPILFIQQWPTSLSCKASQQKLLVPSEDGGTREVTITRCGTER
jgi:hypothetical protein